NSKMKAVNAYKCDAYYQRYNNCFFGNDVNITGEDYAFTNNQQYGIRSFTSFSSSKVAGIVLGNSFNSSQVRLMGDYSVKS
ncbi:hypothetical protein, partial [Propionibacterium freudenreichii]|uniref:hypothetical protein n=1 Tax=Propionibacterium freudenreichii TaxID=1744 RepID=UPI003857AFEC